MKLTLVESSKALLHQSETAIIKIRDVTIQHSVDLCGSSSGIVDHCCCASDVLRHFMEHAVVGSARPLELSENVDQMFTHSNLPSPTSPRE